MFLAMASMGSSHQIIGEIGMCQEFFHGIKVFLGIWACIGIEVYQ